MSEIARITLREIHLPLVEPFRSAGGVVTDRRVLLLALADGDGIETWSECVAESLPSYSAETVDTCWLAITEWLGPFVIGRDFNSAQALSAGLDRHVRGHLMAKAALEMGAWGLEAQRLDTPLASLVAGASAFAREREPAPRPRVESGIALGMQSSPEALVERVREALSAGYRRIKMKIEPGRDIAFVHAVRDAVGSGVSLIADANCSYAHCDSQVEMLGALDAFSLSMIEQPLGPDDLVGHAELQGRISTPICLDESITGVASTRAMLALESGRIVNLKPGRVGGLTAAIAIHDICASAAIPVWCGGMLETGIGRAYNVALASLPGFTEPGDLSPSERYWKRDLVTPAWTMDSTAHVRVPLDRGGLGVEVDVGWVDDLTARVATIRPR